MKSFNNDRTLIIGGGVIGLSLAWELARRKHQVELIESDPVIHPLASWAGAGILPPAATSAVVDPYEQLKQLSYQLHPQWAAQLQADTGIDTGFRQCGGIYLASSLAEQATLLANEYWWQQHEIAFQRLSTSELSEREPGLAGSGTQKVRQAWFLPGEYQVRNPRHLKALRSACQQLGVIFRTATVRQIDVDASQRATVCIDQGDHLNSDRICICAGAWSRMLLEQLQLANGIMPVRGQMLLYRSKTPLVRHIINDGNRYLVPRDDGHLLAGSVEEEVGYCCETTQVALQVIQQWANSVLPQLQDLPVINRWAGLRPGSFDSLPYLGSIPGTKNIFVAAGHFRSGLYLSCGTAVVMANLMLGQPNSIDLWPFRPGRG